MPSAKNVSNLVENARPLVVRLTEDEELQQSLRSALGSAHRVYSGLSEEPSRRGAALRLAADPNLRDDLRDALAELRFASQRAREPQRRSRLKGLFVFGVIAAFVLLNPFTGPPLRAKLSQIFSGSSGLDYGD